ncbi:hypothetical protein PG996_008809 [Apiospora saccharicola]|uniref:Uncharacterized protein n=1 Tax=Apiospora saccharicola TaxID=335842 RepID=A0ABR1UZ22_9PEZI
MTMIMGQLDLQSLARLSQVSLQADGYVRSFRDYRSLVVEAAEVVQALFKMGLIGLHSAGDLYSALLADACSDMAKLPVIHVQDLTTSWDALLPFYQPHPPPPPPSPGVSAKAARKLAIAVHGSEKKLTEVVRKSCCSEDDLDNACYWLDGPKVQPRHHWLSEDNRPDIPVEPEKNWQYNCNMPPILFPVLTGDGLADLTLWCRGCQRVSDHASDIDEQLGSIWTLGTFPTPQPPPLASLQSLLPPNI